MNSAPRPGNPFLIFAILSGLFILSMFYRVSNAVIAPNLISDLGLSAETLGILGGAYFYSFALLQLPMGPMLDRLGPRYVVTVFPLIGALGAFLFALGESFTAVLWGRILIGLGMSSILMGSMKIFILWFPPGRFATLVGLMLSVGTLGNILAATPLAFLASTIGWRMTFIIAGVITALLALLFFRATGMAEEREVTPIAQTESEMGILQSLRLILTSLVFWQMGMAAFFRYGTFVGLSGLWLGPYLIDIKGYTPVQTGDMLILLAVGMIVGGPVAGRLSDHIFHSRKGVALWGLGLYGLTIFPLIGVIKIESSLSFGMIFFLMGFFSSFGMIIFSHAKELFPQNISGTVITMINFFTMAGAAIFMPAMGRIIEFFPRTNQAYPAEAYHLSFLVCFVGVVGSAIFYAFAKKE